MQKQATGKYTKLQTEICVDIHQDHKYWLTWIEFSLRRVAMASLGKASYNMRACMHCNHVCYVGIISLSWFLSSLLVEKEVFASTCILSSPLKTWQPDECHFCLSALEACFYKFLVMAVGCKSSGHACRHVGYPYDNGSSHFVSLVNSVNLSKHISY